MSPLTSIYRDSLVYKLRDAARNTSVSELSRQSGISRDTLYQALSEKGNPSLTTLIALVIALKLKIELKPLEEKP